MSVTIQPFIQAVAVPASDASPLFTASGLSRIDAMTLYNPIGNAAELVTVHIVPAGGSADPTNEITSQNCLAGVTYNLFGAIGQTLAPGDAIHAAGAAGDLVNLFASGTVQS